MSFSLQAVNADGEREEYFSLSNQGMADVRELLIEVADADHGTPVARLIFNNGSLVEPDDCRWIARPLRAVDREAVMPSRPSPDELLAIVDEFADFCHQCAGLGGFEVW